MHAGNSRTGHRHGLQRLRHSDINHDVQGSMFIGIIGLFALLCMFRHGIANELLLPCMVQQKVRDSASMPGTLDTENNFVNVPSGWVSIACEYCLPPTLQLPV